MEKEKIDAILGIQKNISEGSQENAIKEEIMAQQPYYGEAKSDNDVNDLQDDDRPFLISVIGFPECGKSTFVSSIYHLCMTRGGIGSFKFFDSDTLIGFEKRALIRHIKTDVKNRNLRTQVYENPFLSLSFRNVDGRVAKVIISDKSGETYEKYKDRAGLAGCDVGLINADVIVLLVDANKFESNIVNEQKRLRIFLARLRNEGVCQNGAQFFLVMNKMDICNQKSIEDLISGFIEKNRDNIPEISSVKYIQSIKLRQTKTLEEFVTDLIAIKFSELPNQVTEDIDWVRSIINRSKDV